MVVVVVIREVRCVPVREGAWSGQFLSLFSFYFLIPIQIFSYSNPKTRTMPNRSAYPGLLQGPAVGGPSGGPQNYRNLASQGIGIGGGVAGGGYGGQQSAHGRRSSSAGNQYHPPSAAGVGGDGSGYGQQHGGGSSSSKQQSDEIVVSAAMQQLREPGVLIVAHGSRGKPKTVRLQLTESAVTWRTETRKKSSGEPKVGKLHQVPLAHIMYVDVGKQTTALRRVENSSVPESLCFSLLTKEGSLDLEANSPRERDALVSCFSLVLDEVHAQNWRDIYRGPSSEMPSSFDEADHDNAMGAANKV
mmetsp:Transcript_36728/g.74833  ORF Transcript_36728/g.74833 Transcript_36728/m.74833 type:complete len:303 (-) Transcript_36728:1133-2041(-)